jgi:CSLREA domain-containing protein
LTNVKAALFNRIRGAVDTSLQEIRKNGPHPIEIRHGNSSMKIKTILPPVLCTLFLSLFSVQAQTVVTTAVDEDDGNAFPGTGSGTSLREAIAYAAPNSTLTFDAALNGETITLINGQLTLSVNLELDATPLPNGIVIKGNYPNRIFHCTAGTTNTLSGLTLTGGVPASPSIGGSAILNEGMLTLNACSMYLNRNEGLGRGTVMNTGTLIMNQCTVDDNEAGSLGEVGGLENNGTATLNNCTIYDHDIVGIRNTAGSILNINNTIVSQNSPNILNSGTINEGGINYLNNSSELGNRGYYGGSTPTRPPLAGSPFIDPVGGDLTSPFTSYQQGNPRLIGPLDIGAVEFQGAIVTTAVDEDNGNMKPGVGNGTSLREALKYANNDHVITFALSLADQDFHLPLGRVAISKNIILDPSAIDSVHMIGSSSNGLFSCAAGTTNIFNNLTLTGGSATNGGAFLNAGHLTLNQCTLTGNTATHGGAIYNTTGAVLRLNSSTVFGNSADDGGGVYSAGSVDLDHSIVAGNTATTNENIRGPATLLSSISLISGDPMLAPLDDYDGATPTCPPLPGSPAIDPLGGSSTNILFSTDQRGLPRIINGMLDLGATEIQPAVISNTASDYSEGSLLLTYLRASPGTTLTFADHLSGTTIALTNGPLPLYRSIIIDGTSLAEPIIFDGLKSNRLFECTSPEPVSLIGLTLTGGYHASSGGGIRNDGFLTLDGCTLTNNYSDNFGGAIYNDGTLYISNSILHDNHALTKGGALFVLTPSTNVTFDTVFSGNTARQGGAVYVSSVDSGPTSTRFDRCLFKANRAEVFAGSEQAKGGALCTYAGGPTDSVILNQCTLTENESTFTGSALFVDTLSSMTLNQCTITGNPLGGRPSIDSFIGYLNMHNTIVAGNPPESGTQIASAFVAYNATGINITSGDPMLAPLGDYGGLLPSFLPLPGSPAINPAAGDIASPFEFDPRGEARMVGGIVDVGAVEFQGMDDLLLDQDGDGTPLGVEYALGTDWLTPDATNSANFAGFLTNGMYATTFGFNPDATNAMSWIVHRSTNLVAGAYEEIYRYDGPAGLTTSHIPLSATLTNGQFVIIEQSTPRPTNAFYRFEAEIYQP